MISPSEITIVFQGNVSASTDGDSFRNCLEITRAALPGARVILSTWQDTKIPKSIDVDEVVRSEDPGTLPPIKFDDVGSNNINRQIVSTLAGLQKVKTQYAIKLRTDSFLEHDGFLKNYVKFNEQFRSKSDRILTSSFFTIDPFVFEHMPFHTSDWFQFSTTSALINYWSRPLVTLEEATFYENNRHARHSSYLDKKFRTMLAVEQYLCGAYAKRFGYDTPAFHNDCRKEVLKDFQHFLANHFMILDPWQAGFRLPKYNWAYKSNMQSMNCIMFLDWYRFCAKLHPERDFDPELSAAAKKRYHQKIRVGLGNRLLNPIAAIIFSKKFDPIGSRLLKLAMWSRRAQRDIKLRPRW
ncbi:WavE lipopolysaccharide synthesis protein [Paraburkholderia eburnea]|uniref:WavE lipopolysaccharide synthesis protein n=1 Tax=Paraburkholderia eburnea TaxID=1189126 RepID=A0A2S4MMC0_9BURK|nr:WavE lipopolysaccharide synthesis family protein [Paraburkholderia eburnea]POR55890.1 WavE lipopolysaccharide synthesis protein [Paraburkholderia eburnea]PRZ27017.1 WavE lipopolysaccharide synthesis protein [Paraburkholderia eburnea]